MFDTQVACAGQALTVDDEMTMMMMALMGTPKRARACRYDKGEATLFAARKQAGQRQRHVSPHAAFR
ncbi:MAG: hypothetical protein AAFR04_10130 [Pseudomonadota bacterium]